MNQTEDKAASKPFPATGKDAAGGSPTSGPELIKAAVEAHLSAAEKAAESDGKPWERLVDSWTGAPIESAFLNLHAAEVAMIPLLETKELRARFPEVLARLKTCSRDDERRVAAENSLRKRLSGASFRAAYTSAVKYGYEIKDAEHERVRSFRNIVLATTLGLTFVVLTLCIVGVGFPDAIPLCFPPTSSTTTETSAPSPTAPAETTAPAATRAVTASRMSPSGSSPRRSRS